MKHSIRIILAAAVGAGALLLTGCTKDTDLSARYGDYMKYSFGADYTFECFTTDEHDYDYYNLTYHDSTGRERTTDSSADIMILPYEKRRSSKTDLSEEDYYTNYLEVIVTGQMGSIFEDGLKEKVLKPCFPSYNPDPKAVIGNLGSASLIVQSKTVFTRSDANDAALPFVTGRLVPETGWKVCAADFCSVASDPEWFVTITVTVDDGTDPQPYIEQMQAAEARYREEAQAPQNYSMIVKQKQSGDSEALWRSDLVLGEYVVYERCKEVDPDFTPLRDAREKLLVKE